MINGNTMEKYIKQEMTDLQKTGEQKSFYRMKVERNIDIQEFVECMWYPCSDITVMGRSVV